MCSNQKLRFLHCIFEQTLRQIKEQIIEKRISKKHGVLATKLTLMLFIDGGRIECHSKEIVQIIQETDKYQMIDINYTDFEISGLCMCSEVDQRTKHCFQAEEILCRRAWFCIPDGSSFYLCNNFLRKGMACILQKRCRCSSIIQPLMQPEIQNKKSFRINFLILFIILFTIFNLFCFSFVM